MKHIQINPSILSADLARLGDDVKAVLAAGLIIFILMLWIITMCLI